MTNNPNPTAARQEVREQAIRIIRDVLAAYAIDASNFGIEKRQIQRQMYAEHAADKLAALAPAPVAGGAPPMTPKMAEAGKAKLIELGYEGVEFTDAQKVYDAMQAVAPAEKRLPPSLAGVIVAALTDRVKKASTAYGEKERQADLDEFRSWVEAAAPPQPGGR